MEGTIPNFKVGEPASNNSQTNKITDLDNGEKSFVVLAKNVVGSLKYTSQFSNEDASKSWELCQSVSPSVNQSNSAEDKFQQMLDKNPQLKQTLKKSDIVRMQRLHQSVSPSASQISSLEDKYQHILEENSKLKQTLKESDTMMKQQFEKIEEWQKQIMSVCCDHNQKYLETIQGMNRIKAENDYLRIILQNQSQKCVNPESSTVSQDVAKKSNNLNTLTISMKSIDTEQSLTQNNPSTETTVTPPVRTRDSSLDNNMTVISLKSSDTRETSLTKTQCASTECESLITSTETSTMDNQCSSTVKETPSTEVHSNLNKNKSVSLADIENKLQKMLEENRELKEQSEKMIAQNKDVMALCYDQSKSPIEAKKMMDQMVIKDIINNITQSQEENCIETQIPITSKTEDHTAESNNCDAVTASSASRDKAQSLPLNDSSAKMIESAKLSSLSLDDNMTIVSLMSTKTTQTPTSKTQCVGTETNSSTTCAETQTSNTVAISESAEETEETDKKGFNKLTRCLKFSFLTFLYRENSIKTINAYKNALIEMDKYFTVIYSHGANEESIAVDCIKNMIRAIENIKYCDDGSITDASIDDYVNALTDYIKNLEQVFIKNIDCKENKNQVKLQFRKVLSDYNFLINELVILTVERAELHLWKQKYVVKEKDLDETNKKLSEEKAALMLEKLNLNNEKARIRETTEQLLIGFRTIDQEKERMANERKDRYGAKEIDDRQEKLCDEEKSVLKLEIVRLEKTCNELKKKLEDMKVDSDTLNVEKKNLAQERESFEELKKLLDDEIKSHQEQHQALANEINILKNKCEMLEMDNKIFNSELIESHKTITKLRKDIASLQEAASTLEVYKVQNNAQAKDIMHMLDAEQNYLEEIERLSNEIEKLREANKRLQD